MKKPYKRRISPQDRNSSRAQRVCSKKRFDKVMRVGKKKVDAEAELKLSLTGFPRRRREEYIYVPKDFFVYRVAALTKRDDL